MALERERSRLQAEFLQREEGLRARLQEVRPLDALSGRHMLSRWSIPPMKLMHLRRRLYSVKHPGITIKGARKVPLSRF